jgi:hypothetical protein
LLGYHTVSLARGQHPSNIYQGFSPKVAKFGWNWAKALQAVSEQPHDLKVVAIEENFIMLFCDVFVSYES